MTFEKVNPVFPSITTKQRVDLKFLSEVGHSMKSQGVTLLPMETKIQFNEQLQELIQIVNEHKLLETVENERIMMELDGGLTLMDLTLDEDDPAEA